jgi:transcriptional regulator with XRE-family HTH domain
MTRDPQELGIGSVLRDLRLQRGLSQEQLATKAKMHRNYIGGLERGEKSPTFKSVGKLLAALGVSWTELGKALDDQS